MPCSKAFLIPLSQGILYPVTFLITYTLSVLNRDVPPLFPYVSDTGAWSLEKCIFTFMLGIGSLLMYLTVYIRHRQVQEILEGEKNKTFKPLLKKINKLSVNFAVVSVIGLFILGCFQVWPFIHVHLLGAAMTFCFGWMVLAIQTYISFQLYPILGSKCLNIFRAILVLILGAALNLTGLFGVLSFLQFEGGDVTQWTSKSGGYAFHLVSVANEWILVLGVVLYLALYTKEFKSIVIYKPKIELFNI